MNPRSLKLKGFRGILAGLGLEEVFLDLSAAPAGLIAVTGPNGAGKTTIMDNLHPFRIMPYKMRRSKDWNPAGFSFYEQCGSRDAVKELIWDANGTTYRTLLLIDAEKRKQEAYLYQEETGAGVASWVPLNDGKTKTYDAAVESVIGSPTLFFSSVFRSQCARALSDYSRGDFMGLISELLNLNSIKEKSEKARAVAAILTAKRVTLDGERTALAGRLMRHANCTAELEAARLEVSTIEKQIAASTGKVRGDQEQLQELRTRLAGSDGLREQLRGQEEALGAARRRLREAEVERIARAEETAEVRRGLEPSTQRVREAIETATKMVALSSVVRNNVTREAEAREHLVRFKEESTVLDREIAALDGEERAVREQLRVHQEATAATEQRLLEATTDVSAISGEMSQVKRDWEPSTQRVMAAIERATKMVANADEVRAKVAEEATAREQLAGSKENLARLEQARVALGEQEALVRGMRDRLAAAQRQHQTSSHEIDGRLQSAKSQLEVAQRDAGKLKIRDCKDDGGDWVNPRCEFVSSAEAARDLIPSLQKTLSDTRSENDQVWADWNQVSDDFLSQIAAAGADTLDGKRLAMEGGIRDCQADIVAQEKSVGELARWTRCLPEVERATTDLVALNEELAEMEQAHQARLAAIQLRLDAANQKVGSITGEEMLAAQGKGRGLDATLQHLVSVTRPAQDTRRTAMCASISDHEQSIEVLVGSTSMLPEVERAEAEIGGLKDELATLEQAHATRLAAVQERAEAAQRKTETITREEVYPAQTKVTELQALLNAVKDEDPTELEQMIAAEELLVTNHNEALRTQLGVVGRLEQERTETAKASQEDETIGVRIGRFDQEIARFRRLEKNLGNDGVISLEIEDSGPGIATLANDLLDTCYGPRFSVRIETQAEKRDGGMKDSFDVIVFDSETSEAVSITEKSGGQVTWIEDAITRAICLYQIHGSGKTFHALFTDEADGSLDAARKLEFLAVKRRAMDIGAHDREFFVSQTQELVEMANARIVVGDGAARLVM